MASEANWDRLLEWMTHVGSGPWDAFRQAVDELDPRHDEDRRDLYRSLRILLSDMGHVDFFVGGSRRWCARRPALVGTPQRGHDHLFTGGRSSSLLSSLVSAARDVQAVVAFHEDHPGLSRVRIQGDPDLLKPIAMDLEIEYLRDGPGTLATLLAPLASTLEAAEEADEPIGWNVRSWSLDEARWVEGRLSRSLREYTNRHGVRRHLVDTGRRRPLLAVERRAGMYCAALASRTRLVNYASDERTLRVPRWAPLPAEHARVACLAAGRPASLEDGHIVFKEVDPRFASALLASLGQGVSMPRTSR